MSNNINFLKKKTVLNDILSNRNVSVINNTKYDPNDENDKGLLLNTINNAETNTDKYIISYDNVDLNISYNDIKELYRSKSWLSNNQVSFDEFKDNVNYYNNYNKNGIQDLTYTKYDQSLNTNTLLIDNTYNSLYYVRPDKINLMSYSIKNKDGFNYDENNHVLKFNIDNNYIKSINNLLYYNYNNIRNTSSDKTGIASIDDKFFDVKNYNNSYSNNILTINKEFKTEIYSTLNKIKNLYNDCKVIYNKEKTSQTITENGENNKIGGININNTEIRFEDPKLYYDDDVVGVNSLDLANADTLYVFDLDNADFRLGYTDTLDYDYKENQYTSNASANSLSNDVKNSTLKNRISLTLSENDASANIIANQHIKSNHVIGTTYNIDLGDISKNSFNANGLSILYKASPYKISTEDSGQLITIPYDKELNIRKIAGTFGKYFYTTEIERIAEYLFVSSHYDIKGFRIPDSSFNYLKSRNTITDIFNLQYYSVLKAGYGYPEVYPILNLYPNNYINEKYFDSDLISYYDENNNTVDSEIIATEDELSTCVSKIRDIYLDDVKCLYFYKLLHKDGYYETVGEPNILIFEEDIDSCLTFIARNDVYFTFTVPEGAEDNAKYIQFSLDGVTWEYLINDPFVDDITQPNYTKSGRTYILNHKIENSNKILWRAKFYNFKLSDDHKYIEDTVNENKELINDKPYYVYPQYDYITATPNLANGIGAFGAICSNGDPKFEIFGNSMSLIYGCPYIEYVDEISNEKTNVYCTKLSDKPHIFDKLFSGSYIVSAKRLALPATSLEKSNFCYQEMFLNCSHLTDSPKLPAEILSDRCYKGMFKNCIALQSAPRLDALTMKAECYKEMFCGCEALLMPPNVTKKYPTGIFMSKELAYGCYESMFEGCKNLRVMPQLTASKMKENCYKKMFKDCGQIGKAVNLPVIQEFAKSCFYFMFYKTQIIPHIVTSGLKINLCEGLYFNAKNNNEQEKFVNNVKIGALQGIFGGTNIEYIELAKFLPKDKHNNAYLNTYLNETYNNLDVECYLDMFYNAVLLDKAPYIPATEMKKGCYYRMFYGCSSLQYIPEFTINTSAEECCYQMFYEAGTKVNNYLTFRNSGFVNPNDDLQIRLSLSNNTDVLSKKCYYQMFFGCNKLYDYNLEDQPIQVITTIGGISCEEQSCESMFEGCANIKYTTSSLPATTLAEASYKNMYKNCSALIDGPQINAQILANQCCMSMFEGCTLLTNTTSSLPATILKDECYKNMYKDCQSLSVAPSIDNPENTTTLAEECCMSMFEGCRALIKSPDLLATELVENCYERMFYGCENLIFIKALFLTAPMNESGVENPVGDENPAFATDDWVYGVKNFDEKNNNNLIDSFEDYNEKYSHQSQQQIQFTDNLINNLINAIKNRADDDNDGVLDNYYVDVNNENGVLGLFIRNAQATWIVKENIGVDGIPKYWNVYSSEGAKEYPVFVFFHSDSYRNYEDYSKLIYGFPGDNYGDDVPNSNMFPRRGYSFSGWSNLKNSNNIDFTSITIKNQKFIDDKQYWAVWNANTYDIYWYYNLENRLYDTTSGAYDTLISDHKPNPMPDINRPIPTHHYPYADGYIFWSWSSIQNPQEQLVYVNRNTPTDYFMRPIDINGPGYDPNMDNIDNDPETLKRETNTVGIDIEDENNFYAVWKYIVKWNAKWNGNEHGSYNTQIVPNSTSKYYYQNDYLYGDDLSFPTSAQEPNSINDTLYKFGGWATSSTTYIPDMYTDSINYNTIKAGNYWRPTSRKSYNVTEPKNYYATWEYRMLWYRLPNDLYVTNYGYYNDSVKYYQPAYPLRTGYTPKGWNTSAGQTIENISSRNVDNNTDNNIFYVVWEANECTIYWYKFGGEQAYHTTSGAYDSLVTDHLPGNDDLPSETGYEFIGWNTSPLATEDNITGVTVKESNDNNFYAVWWYIVTWHYGNHSSDHPDTTSKFKYNDNIILPTESTSEDNCTFIGWYTQKDFNTENGTGTQITTSTKVTSPVTYYARYQCTITFNYNGGSGSTNSETIECGASLGNKLPTNPSRANYTFNGWRTTQDGNVRVLPATKFTSHTTIYASWGVNSHTITFNYTDGYSGDELSRPVNAGDPIGTLPTGKKEGYYDSNTWQYNGTVIDSTFTMPDYDIELTLQESGPRPYTITFNYGNYSGNESSRTVYYGNQIKYLTSGEVKDLPTGTRDGYDPSNTWQYNGTVIDSTFTMPAHDIILTLVESDPIQYGIIFKLGDSNYTYINSSGITIISANPNYGTTLGNAVNPWPTAGGSPQYENTTRWKKEGTNDEVDEVDSNTIIEGPMTLVPINGGVRKFTVTFKIAGSVYESVTTSSVERSYGAEIGTLPTASDNQGVYLNTSRWQIEGGSEVFSTDRVYGNMTLIPIPADQNNHTVTFRYSDGFSGETTKRVTHGSQIGTLPTATREGYHPITSWRLGNGDDGTLINSSYEVTSDIDLYMDRTQIQIYTYTITFTVNGTDYESITGASDDNGKSITYTLNHGQYLGECRNDSTLPQANDSDGQYEPTRRWKIKDTVTEVTDQTVVEGNMILEPMNGDPQKRYVIFKVTGSSYGSILGATGDGKTMVWELSYGQRLGEKRQDGTLPKAQGSSQYKDSSRWKLENGSDQEDEFTAQSTITSDITLVPINGDLHEYNVTFMVGNTGYDYIDITDHPAIYDCMNVSYGTTLGSLFTSGTLPMAYDNDGEYANTDVWKIDGTTTVVTANFEVKSDLTLIPTGLVSKHTVTWHYNYYETGTTFKVETEPDKYYHGSAIGTLKTASRDCAFFDGWYANESFTGNPIGTDYVINDDTHLYLKWNLKEYFRTTFNAKSYSYKATVGLELYSATSFPSYGWEDDTLQYSEDEGLTWNIVTKPTSSSTYITWTIENTSKSIIWRGTQKINYSAPTSIGWLNIVSSKIDGGTSGGECDLSGYLSSLVHNNSFVDINNGNIEYKTDGYYYNTFSSLFYNSSSIGSASSLKLNLMGILVYNCMFAYCRSLVYPPILSTFNTIGPACFMGMFSGCMSLNEVPTLPNVNLSDSTSSTEVYKSMFKDCTSLTTVPNDLLKSTTLTGSCYASMFEGCTALTNAPELPASTLADECYASMFKGCTSLITAPVLNAETLVDGCYKEMFNGCSSLRKIECYATNISAEDCTKDWVAGVPTDILNGRDVAGDFYRSENNNNWAVFDVNGIPTNWEIHPNLNIITVPWFAITCNISGSNGDGISVTLSMSTNSNTEVYYGYENINGQHENSDPTNPTWHQISSGASGYGRDDGTHWWDFLFGGPATEGQTSYSRTIFVKANGHVYFDMSTFSTSNANSNVTVEFSVSGNPITLKAGTNKIVGGGTYYFDGNNANLFARNNTYKSTLLTNASNLELYRSDINMVSNECYKDMFANCVGLTSPPALPSPTLANNCYEEMFYGCTSLSSLPSLGAQTLAFRCYSHMFGKCSSLTQVPSNYLNITTLEERCYEYMFEGCTALTSAPELPASTLKLGCYQYMFNNCTSLTTLPTDMIKATTLAEECCRWMFHNCSSLTNSDQHLVLHAETLARACYEGMFFECTDLRVIICLATYGMIVSSSSDSENYDPDYALYVQSTDGWVVREANVNQTIYPNSNGKFYKNSQTEFREQTGSGKNYWGRGSTGVPYEWQVLNYGA